ncbi:betaine/proline/choline family ABC transporter ATP-binding protein [Sediminispirochaeta bajacaliforniensis]|uniref:betaine/proline/choline family ABC transporter ATP-binding protein n=1 Tax=Sediminispirochaeta bajacaliforniensis TaxID=148 RepID=UPI0003690EF2|nr:betaine/proline/choline family ABC transporter ATP-binding protein [Sediminispirochaeta bajacaliforniensis]
MIELKRVTKRFDKKLAVKDLSMTIEQGKITMLIGPSGCGKTTTLKMINRLIDATEGDITISGRSIYDLDAVQLRRSIGYVIQETGLFPHMDVFTNIAMVPRLIGWDERKIKNRVDELLHLVTLNGSYVHKYPLQLSGGERQRVGLARALAADPEILLMDEPFGAIDPINRSRLHDSFLSIQEKIEKTIVFVTHDINEAIKLGDKIAIMQNGNLVQYDNVNNILYEPENKFVEKLLGHDRNIKALVLKKNKDYIVTTGYVQVHKSDKPEAVIRKMEEKGKRVAIVTDSEEKFLGLFALEKSRKDPQPHLSFIDNAVTVEKNNNLQETFSLMIDAGESSLPVVTEGNRFVGAINLEDIFNEFKKAQED